jgi:hypothetical protein
MKKILLFVPIILGFANTIFAQALSITPADSVSVEETVTTNNDEVVLYAYVKNDSTEDVTVTWRIIENDSPLDWSVSYCDNTNCLDLSTTTQSSFLLKADSSSILKMAYLPFLVDGESNIEVQVSIAGVPSSVVNVTYFAKVIADPVSIRDIDASTLSIYPNPTTNFIQIKGIENANQNTTLEVYSIIGKKVLTQNIPAVNEAKINVQNLENGVYLVKLFDQQRNLFYTKTFVKK